MRRSIVLSIAALLAIGLLGFWSRSSIASSQDVQIYEKIGSMFQDDKDQIQSEYPPLASSIFYLVENNAFQASFATAWMYLLFLCFVGACLYAYVVDGEREMILVACSLLGTTLLFDAQMIFARFDILIGILILLCALAHTREYYRTSGLFLMLGIGIKLTPLLILPFLWITTPAKKRRELIKGLAIGLCGVTALPCVLLGPVAALQNISYMIDYHANRGIQIESLWSGLTLLWKNLGHTKANIEFHSMAHENMSIGKDIRILSIVSMVTSIALLWFHSIKKYTGHPTAMHLLGVMVLLLAIAWSPILSPQYFLWVMPLLIYWILKECSEKKTIPRHVLLIGLSTLCIGIATQWIYPYHYWDLVRQESSLILAILNARNVGIFVLVWLLYKEQFGWTKHKKEKPAIRWKRDTTIAVVSLCALVLFHQAISVRTGNARFQFENQIAFTNPSLGFIDSQGESLTLRFPLIVNALHPALYRVKPDDCIQSMYINDVPIPSSIAEFCDYGTGRSLLLGPYLRPGINIVELSLRDQGGKTGLSLQASRNDTLVILFHVAFIIFCTWFGWKLITHFLKKKDTFYLWQIFLAGSILRLLYVLSTSPYVRSYDVSGHIDYIRYIVDHAALPASSAGWEFHQAPLYYVLMALWMKIGMLFDRPIFMITNDLQLFSLLCSIATLGCALWIVHLLYPKKSHQRLSLLFGWLLAVFPTLVFFSSRITNDALYHFLCFLFLALLIAWWKKGETNYWYWSIFVLAIICITKVSGYALLPVPFLCLLIKTKTRFPQKISRAILSGLLLLLLAGWLPAYRFLVEEDHARTVNLGNYHINEGLRLPDLEAKHLVLFNPYQITHIPFNNTWDDKARRAYYWEFFYRSLFFGEFSFSTEPLRGIAVLLLMIGFFGIPLCAIGMYNETRKNLYDSLPLLSTFFLLMASSLAYRILFPFGPNADFRFIPLALVPIVWYTLQGTTHLRKPWQTRSHFLVILFSGLSALFLILLYLMD